MSFSHFSCDGILQCVHVQAGTSILVFTYKSLGLKMGETISALSALLVLGALFYGVIVRIARLGARHDTRDALIG